MRTRAIHTARAVLVRARQARWARVQYKKTVIAVTGGTVAVLFASNQVRGHAARGSARAPSMLHSGRAVIEARVLSLRQPPDSI